MENNETKIKWYVSKAERRFYWIFSVITIMCTGIFTANIEWPDCLFDYWQRFLVVPFFITPQILSCIFSIAMRHINIKKESTMKIVKIIYYFLITIALGFTAYIGFLVYVGAHLFD